MPSGRELGEWELPNAPGRTGRISRLLAAGGDRFLVAEFTDHPESNAGPDFRLVERILDRLLPDGPDVAQGWVVLLDVIERRVSRPVPGEDAALSPNGQWLATIDGDGVLRVWSVPLGRPWGRALAYATVVVFGVWGLFKVLSRVRRRLWPRAD